MLKIQYVSDLHLEFYERVKSWDSVIKPAAPILILAGDIGNPVRALLGVFLEYCSANWERVFYVAGNHEFYNKDKKPSVWFRPDTIDTRLHSLRELCAKHRITFLDREEVVLCETDTSKIILLGATLWTHPTHEAFYLMNDVNCIWTDGDGEPNKLSIEAMYEMNGRDKTWLRERVAHHLADSRVSLIVVTHHLPTPDVILAKYMEPTFISCTTGFANTDLTDLLKYPILAWICGHTHGCKTLTLDGGTIVTTNTLGYPGENMRDYKSDATISFSVAGSAPNVEQKDTEHVEICLRT